MSDGIILPGKKVWVLFDAKFCTYVSDRDPKLGIILDQHRCGAGQDQSGIVDCPYHDHTKCRLVDGHAHCVICKGT